MRRHLRKSVHSPYFAARAVVVLLGILVAPSIVFAHAVVFPKTKAPRANEK